jgi:polyisoprenoid-binding protein YceI
MATPGATVIPRAGGVGTLADSDEIPPPPAGPGVYAIDPAQSEVRLLVYRAGPMARLGHNHVITHRAIGGWIKFTGNPTAATFALSLPVADFVVDSAGARALEGTDFFEEVSEDAKEGTQHNMLGPALLDAAQDPTISLVSVSVAEKPPGLIATMRLRVAGHESTLMVPFLVATGAGQISASGIIKLRQSALGLKPFSIMLGALQVQDEFTVKFTLVAATK